MSDSNDNLVYSTRTGDLRKQTATKRGLTVSKPPQQQDVRVRRETKGRKGKVVTVIAGFALTEKDLKTLSKTLKGVCGAGGAVKIEADGTQLIEVQGDHREAVAEKLRALNYKVKFAGG